MKPIFGGMISRRLRQWMAVMLSTMLFISVIPIAEHAEAAPSDGTLDFPALAASTTGLGGSIDPLHMAALTDDDPATQGRDYKADADKSFILDFGEAKGVKVSEVKMQARASFPKRLKNGRVEGSLDGVIWTTITSSAASDAILEMQTLPIIEEYQSVPFRFLKIRGDGDANIFNIGELRINGTVVNQPNLIDSVSISSNHEGDSAKALAGDTITLEFASTAPISNVNVNTNGRPSSVQSPDGIHWTASYTVLPYDFPGAATFAITYTDEEGNYGKLVTSTTDGSAVSIVEPSDYRDLRTEAAAFGIPVKDANGDIVIEYGTTAANLANLILDGNPGTFADARGPNNDGRGIYLVVDMGEGNAIDLKRAYILARGDQIGRLGGAYLQGSNDGTTWTTISSGAAGIADWQTLAITNQSTYRYVKITNETNSAWFLNMAEIKLYGSLKQAGVLYPYSLQDQVAAAQNIVQAGQGSYTDESWQILADALQEGQAALTELDNGNSSGLTQDNLDTLAAALLAAINGLIMGVEIISETSEEGFIHPGVGVTKEVLENVRTQINNKQEPWYSYYNALLESDFATTDFKMSNSLDGVTIRQDSYNASNVKDMAVSDGTRAFTQAFLYYMTGNEVYRSNALRILTIWGQMDPNKYQYFADAHIHTGPPLYSMVMAAELLRYTTSSEELKWTEEDTERFTQHVIDPTVSTFLDFNDRFMNQHNYPLYGSIASYIFKNDKDNYDKAVEWFTMNDSAPDKFLTGSIYWLFREMTQNDETGEPVEPHVQVVEMGRDLAHSDGDVSNMITLARMVDYQGTKVDPVNGTVTTDASGVSVYEFLDHRILAGADYFFKNQLGYDINWTPVKTSLATEDNKEKIYSIVSDEYKGRLLYTNLYSWDLYYVYRYKLGYTDEQLEAMAPYFVKAFQSRVAPNFYFSGAGSDADVQKRLTGVDWWIHIPEEASNEPLDSIARAVKENISYEKRYILQLEESYSILDGSNEVVESTEYISTKTEGDVSYIRTVASDNQTLFAAYNIFFINRNNTSNVALKIRTNGRAKLELKKEKDSAPFQTLELPDTDNEWKYVTFDMGQNAISYGQFPTRTFLAYFNVVGNGSYVDIDYLDIKADHSLTPPLFNNLTNNHMSLTLFAGSTIEYDFSAMDRNASDVVTYELQGDELRGAVLDPATGAFRWTPTAEQTGAYQSLVVASDGQSVSVVSLSFYVAGDREAAVESTVSAVSEDSAYESASFENYDEVYTRVLRMADTASDSEFYGALDELARAVADLRFLNPLLNDGSLDFTKTSMTSSLQTGYEAYLVDNNPVTFSGDLWAKNFTMDFGLTFKVAPTSFGLQPRNIWDERMAGAIVYGSNDGDRWIPLTEEAAYSSQLQILDVKPERLGEAYRYFKVSTTDTSDYYGRRSSILSVGEFRIYGERSEIPSRISDISISTNAAGLTQHMGNTSNTQLPVKKAIAGDTLTLDITAKQELTELGATIAGMEAEVTQLDDWHYQASVTLTPEAAKWNASRHAIFEINYKYLDAKNNNVETAGIPLSGTTDGSALLVSDASNKIADILSKAALTNSSNRPQDIGTEIGPRLFDNNTDTFVDIRNERGSGDNVYHQFDFGAGGVSLSSVELAPRMTANLSTRMIGVYVAGSNDGVTFKPLSSQSKYSWDWQGLTISDRTYYRYIRIVNQSSWFGNLSELEFFGSYVEDRSTVGNGSDPGGPIEGPSNPPIAPDQTIGKNDFDQALNDAKAGQLILDVDRAQNADDVAVKILSDQVRAAVEAGIKNVEVRTEIATLEFPVSLFTDSDKPAEVVIEVSKVEPSALPADVRAKVGTNLVLDFNLSVGGKKISGFGANEAVRIAYPYTLNDGEKPGQVVIYYIADNGSLEVIKNGRYNPATGMVEFKAKHFSKYAAVPVTVSFADLGQAPWAADSIAALAARSIVKGVSVDSFLPNKDVTRAEFVQMLVQALDLQADGTGESFRDVKAGAWYEQSIITAQALGIVYGKEDGTFGVNERISRQDMAVMTYRAIAAAGVALEPADDAGRFADEAAIASYAREAVTAMQRAGIINGMPNGAFAPDATANRAQAAVILYQLLNLI